MEAYYTVSTHITLYFFFSSTISGSLQTDPSMLNKHVCTIVTTLQGVKCPPTYILPPP